ncbi:RNA polymerase sigma factor [Embleya hyalina]|uniref:RNA polymerase sigma24 factor n=1 Tax=Embleya hyalina TaxID=516124 RepID=A0A401YTB5_9ACTN|nr:SigE family RNA polymerase sigma factor [Embleya hyalina]GCD97795.1 RNA polymerase sigma24 factor [Embleya hyalina]
MRDDEDLRTDFDALYGSTSRRLIAAVYQLTGDVTEAEDAVHEAFARAWERWPTVSAARDPAAWVRTVALRLAVSSWRRSCHRLRAHLRLGGSGHVPDPTPDHVDLVWALRRLPVGQRLVVVLFHLYDLPIEEIAEDLGITAGAVRVRLTRARRALAVDLTTTTPDPPREVAGRTDTAEVRHG